MIRRALCLIVPLLVLAFAAMPAAAQATFVVNSGEDIADHTLNGECSTGTATGGACTLRAAIMEANNTPAADSINFAVSLVTLSLSAADNTSAATGDLDVTEPLTINGNDAFVVSLMTNRIFQVVSDSLSVSNLTFSGVRTSEIGAVFLASINTGLSLQQVAVVHSSGGAGVGVYAANGVTVSIDRSSFAHNFSSDGVLVNSGAADWLVTNTTISNNTGTQVGGVYNISSGADAAEYVHVTLTGNVSLSPTAVAAAGGIYTTGDLAPTVRNSIFTDNRLTLLFAGSDCGSDLNPGLFSDGGNIFSTLSGCPVTLNGDADIVGSGLDPLVMAFGGAISFHSPSVLSPALFIGQDCLFSDQIQSVRPVAGCTAGAIEAPLLPLTTNGGFEDKLAGWTVSGTGVKSKTTDPRTGLRHLEFKGATGSTRSVSQKYPLADTLELPDYVVVDLFARGIGSNAALSITLQFKRDGAEKVKLTYPVENSGIERAPEDYSRTTYRLLVDNPEDEVDIVPRAVPLLDSVTVKLVDKSKSGSKIYVDDVQVYLYGGSIAPGDGARTAAGTRGLPLPLPPIPDGFRGGN